MQTLKEHSINTFPIKQNCEKTSSDRSKKCCTAKRATDMLLCLWLRDGFLQSWFQISVYFFMLDFRKGTATGMCKEAFHKWSKTFNLQTDCFLISLAFKYVSFMLGNYAWAWGLPWSVIDKPNDPPLEKLIFSWK